MSTSHLRPVILAVLVTLAPRPVLAQWTQGEAGKVWVKSALFLQKTDERFDVIGERAPWLGNGESDARALFNDIIVGVHPNVDIWVQIPFFDLRFTDRVQDLKATGFGDIRAWVRWNFAKLNNGSTPIALRAGAKAPIGSSPLDAQIIPLGEGQWDFEIFGEIGHSFWPFPAYAELWLGYRARLENTESLRDPGGEYVYLAEVGVSPVPGTVAKVTLDGLFGRRLRSEGIVTANKRRINILQLGGAVRVGPVWPEAAVRIPLSGQEFPAGPQFVFGFSSQVR